MSTLTGSYDFKTSKNTKDVAAADATSKANEAKKVATNFISSDTSGVMVYDGSSGTQTPSSPSVGTKNVLIDSNGMYVRNGSTNLASFTGSSAQIGQSSVAHSIVDTNGMRVYARDGSTQITNLGYGYGNAESGTATAPYFTFGDRSGTIGNYSVTEGATVTIEDDGQTYTTPIIASGYASHAEGGGTTASGIFSHAEGYMTEASQGRSHAEGDSTVASGSSAHAEGQYSTASGTAGHAEGNSTVASGGYSHAQNSNTIANGTNQTALGRYNVADTTNAVIIGNGSKGSRSNALTIDWNGNVNIASGAKYKINGTNLSASDIGAAPAAGSSSLVNSAQGKIIGRSEICYANSRVDKFTNGEVTVANSSLGVTTGSKPVGILLTPSSSTVVMRYHYDGSNGTNSNIRAYNLDGSGFTGNLRYFAVVFQNTWTTT